MKGGKQQESCKKLSGLFRGCMQLQQPCWQQSIRGRKHTWCDRCCCCDAICSSTRLHAISCLGSNSTIHVVIRWSWERPSEHCCCWISSHAYE